MPSSLFALRLMFECSKSELLHDVSVTRISDTLSYGFLQTDLKAYFTPKYKLLNNYWSSRIVFHHVESILFWIHMIHKI